MESFPDLRRDVEETDSTIYQLFFDLLPRAQEAHRQKDDAELKRIYDFARWCFHQEAEDLWNAAGVAFYEHLVDERITRDEIPRWLEPDDFEDLKGLFEARLEPEEFRELCERYAKRHAPDEVIPEGMRLSRDRRAREIQESIREVLMKYWDPIGVADVRKAKDEYESYVGPVYRLLAGSRSEVELINYLAHVETNIMGLTEAAVDKLREVAKRLLAVDVRL